MGYRIKFQKGFLFVVAAILITVIAVFGSTIAYMYLSSTRSSTNILLSNTAFYIATSGLEVARRAIIANGQTCASVNDGFTNVSFPFNGTAIGQFSIAANDLSTAAVLSANITNTTVNITVNNAIGFDTDGVGTALIESEIITYPDNTTSNQLINVKRGAARTNAVSHVIPSSLQQTFPLVHNHMCVLKSTGQVATVAADGTTSMGKRVLREPIAMGQGYIPVDRSLPGSLLMPAVIGGKSVFVDSKQNSSVNNANIDGLGCSVSSYSGNVNRRATYICKSTFGYDDTVWKSNNEISNNSTIFYNYFFTQSVADLEAGGYGAANAAAINNIVTVGQPGYGKDVVYIAGPLTLNAPTPPADGYLTMAPAAYPRMKTLIVDGDLTISTGVTIGSANNPVKIIVNGNFTIAPGINTTSKIYGFLYVSGTTTMWRNFVLEGALASFDDVIIGDDKEGGATVNFTQNIFEKLSASSARVVQSASEVFY